MFKNIVLLAVGFLAARWWYVDRKGGDNTDNIGNVKDNLYNFLGNNYPGIQNNVAEKYVDMILNGVVEKSAPVSEPVQQAEPVQEKVFEPASFDKKTANALKNNNVAPDPKMMADAIRHMKDR